MTELILLGDGGSRGNPGPAASGFIIVQTSPAKVVSSKIISDIQYDNIVASDGIYLGNTTNNVAEWSSLLFGLEWIINNYNPLEVNLQVLMDSNLVVQQIQRKWKVKDSNLKTYFAKTILLVDKFSNIQFSHIFREYNKHADTLVNQTLDNL